MGRIGQLMNENMLFYTLCVFVVFVRFPNSPFVFLPSL